MEKQEVKMMPRNEIKTVLSKQALFDLEWLIWWYHEQFERQDLIVYLMKMLKVCAKSAPNEFLDRMVVTVSSVLQLNEKLTELLHSEKPWEWEHDDDKNCWRRPEYENF